MEVEDTETPDNNKRPSSYPRWRIHDVSTVALVHLSSYHASSQISGGRCRCRSRGNLLLGGYRAFRSPGFGVKERSEETTEAVSTLVSTIHTDAWRYSQSHESESDECLLEPAFDISPGNTKHSSHMIAAAIRFATQCVRVVVQRDDRGG